MHRIFGSCFGMLSITSGWLRLQICFTRAVTSSGLTIALQAIIITYGGWQSPLYFIEEDRNPARNLPRAMIGGVLSVIGIYLLVNLALLKVLPMSELSGATLPAADAARAVVGTHGRNLIIVLSIISL